MAVSRTHVAELVHAEELSAWYDQGREMVVLDARSEPYFDGNLLPSATWLPYDSTEDEILKALPSKEGCVVVYCHSTECPASGWLAEKLHAMGYAHVFEYPEGIVDWMSKGYPTIASR